MRPGRLTGRSAVTVAVVAAVLVVAGCASNDAPKASSAGATSPKASVSGSATAEPSGSPSPTATPTTTPTPGPAVAIGSIAPTSNTKVGVAMPISVVFAQSVPESQRKAIERHLTVTSSTPVTGAWHWFGTRRVDFRTESYWTPGTTVSFRAALGDQTYERDFSIGADVRTHVKVNKHRTVVKKDGQVIRTMRSNAGSPELPTWTGTMAVVNKARTVRMDSCSVGLACSPGQPNYYDLELPWDVRITWSGTFLHYSSGDPNPGNGNGSHGCVHLSLSDAEWYYNLSKPGDPVTVTGSPRPKADADNGYAGFNLSWPEWVAGSKTGAFTTQST